MLTATLLPGTVPPATCLLELHVTRLPPSPAIVCLAVGWLAGWMAQGRAHAADGANAWPLEAPRALTRRRARGRGRRPRPAPP